MRTLLLLMLAGACSSDQQVSDQQVIPYPENQNIVKYTAEVIKLSGQSYAYHIYQDSNLFIKQETIPAISGNTPFTDSLLAVQTAALVMHKLETGIMPPSLSKNEIDSLINLNKK